MNSEIAHEELKKFVVWYFDNFDLTETFTSTIKTCICGYFHVGQKEAKQIILSCLFLRYLRRRGRNTVVMGDAVGAKAPPTP